MRQFAEITLLTAIATLVFFTGLGRYQYIKTESLRAIVVDEMLDRDGLTMPTAHETPYLKKPPLYAWTTTTIARAVGTFNEFIARVPSAVSGVLLVLLMYGLGEWWISRGAGLCAGVLTLLTPTIADYAMRAELDLPFSLFCTIAIASALAAMDNRRGGQLLWIIAYVAALAGSMWKGPHALIFLWLAMLAYARWTRRWAFLRSPAQWAGCVVVLGLLVWWTIALSAFAGSGSVGKAAGIELFVRLVPHSVNDFVSIILFPIVYIAVTLPASALALSTLDPAVQRACGLPQTQSPVGAGLWQRLKMWWQALRADRLGVMLAAWAGYSFVFMAVAPGKSPRYTIPIFAPVILLGAWAAKRSEATDVNQKARKRIDNVWRGMFTVIGILGIAAAACFTAAMFGVTPEWLGGATARWAWLVMAAGWIVAGAAERVLPSARRLNGRLILLLLVFLTFQPVLKQIWWPAREQADSQTPVIAQLDEHIPGVEPIFVLGNREYPDTQLYSHRRFVFADSIDEALNRSRERTAYCVTRTKELEELTRDAKAKFKEVFHFDRSGHDNVLIKIEQ